MELFIFLFVVLAVAFVITKSLFIRKPKRSQPQSSELVFAPPRPSDTDQLSQEELRPSGHDQAELPIIDLVQHLLTKAVTHKKAKEWEEALACLDEAYNIASQQGYDFMEWSVYLRLPAYLQLAGRNDEAWGWLNRFNCGEFPYKEQSNEVAVQLGWRAMVSDKMRLFLEREKKFKPALIQRSVTEYLRSARAFRRVVDASQEVEAKAWLNPFTADNPELKKMEKDRILQNYEYAQKSAIGKGIPALTEDLFKTAKKAKLSIEATEEIATLVFVMASDVKSELQAVGRVAGVMDAVRAKIDELAP